MTIVIGLSKVLGLAIALLGTLGGVLALIGAAKLQNALGLVSGGFAMALIPGSLVSGLVLVAYGEWWELHIQIEENTRPTRPAELAIEELDWVACAPRPPNAAILLAPDRR
jgi:hypothetical protein